MSSSAPPARFSIAVGSGKGGVGKSTVALNLALAFAENGAKVGILDADVYGPDIPLMVNLKREVSAQYWELARAGQQRFIEPVEEYGVKIISTGFIWGERDPLTLQAGLVGTLLWQFFQQVQWGDLDYLFIDLPPGTADLQQTMTKMFTLTGAIVVVTPQDVAHLDGRKAVGMYRSAGVRVLGGVENMSGLVCPHCKEQVEIFPRVRETRSIWSLGVEKLGEIPMDPSVSFGGDRGRPVMVEHPDSALAWAFRRVEAALTKTLGG